MEASPSSPLVVVVSSASGMRSYSIYKENDNDQYTEALWQKNPCSQTAVADLHGKYLTKDTIYDFWSKEKSLEKTNYQLTPANHCPTIDTEGFSFTKTRALFGIGFLSRSARSPLLTHIQRVRVSGHAQKAENFPLATFASSFQCSLFVILVSPYDFYRIRRFLKQYGKRKVAL